MAEREAIVPGTMLLLRNWKRLPVKWEELEETMALMTEPVVRFLAEMEATLPVVIPAAILKMVPEVKAELEALILKTLPVVRPLAEMEARLVVAKVLFTNSKELDIEALEAVKRFKPVMFWLLPVTRPPNVKALIVKVPARVWMVPPALKLIWLPEVPREMLPLETERPEVAWTPLETSRPPLKELEAVPYERS